MHTKVKDVINDPAFEDYGRLIFPVDMSIDNDLELQDVEEILPWESGREDCSDQCRRRLCVCSWNA